MNLASKFSHSRSFLLVIAAILSFSTLFTFAPQKAEATSQEAANAINGFKFNRITSTVVNVNTNMGSWGTSQADQARGYYVVLRNPTNTPDAQDVFRAFGDGSITSLGGVNILARGSFEANSGASDSFSFTVPTANLEYKIFVAFKSTNDSQAQYSSTGSAINLTGGMNGLVFKTGSTEAANSINSLQFTNITPTGVALRGQFGTWVQDSFTTGTGYYVITNQAPNITAINVKDQFLTGSGVPGTVASGSFNASSTGSFDISAMGPLTPGPNPYRIYIVVEIDGGFSPQFATTGTALNLTGGSGGKSFITNEFPQSTFTVNNVSPGTGDVVRGVIANNGGTVRINFTTPIRFVSTNNSTMTLGNNNQQIQIRDIDGNNVATNASVSNNQLLINFSTVKPDQRYAVTIQPNTLSSSTGGNLGVYNEQLTYMFYTEKKPNLIAASFEPGGHAFNYTGSPFNFNNPNRIYHIDELIGVHKIGVGVNQALVLQFDDYISNLNRNMVSVTSSPNRPDLRYNVEINPDDRSQLLITFDTDDPDKMLHQNTNYTVTIQANAFQDRYGGGNISRNDQMTFRFKTVSGFLSTFINTTASELNQGLFRQYNAHNIAIKIPRLYIEHMETIHYRQGLIANERVAPNLTTVDIRAHADVAMIRLETNSEIPRILRRTANDQFSATFAGLNADVTEIRLIAYDQFGKLLENRTFRLQGGPGEEFKNTYIPQITNSFGQTIPLYRLMSDQQILRDVMEQIPVSELDRIGVFYPAFAPYDMIPVH